MGDKHGWYHGGIPGNYSDDALALKAIYVSVHGGEAKLSEHFYFSERSGFLKNTVGHQKDIIQVVSNGVLSA